MEEKKILVDVEVFFKLNRIGCRRVCEVLVIHLYIIFLPLYIFEKIFFDLVFKCVDIVGRFQV